MHVPSVVGTSMTLLAEDGNKLPGAAKVQSEVFLAAGKTYDVTIQPAQVAPATTPATYAPATYAVYDRALSLSIGGQRDGGMQAFINVAGGAPAGTPSTTAKANPDTYYVVNGIPLAVSDPAKGVIANDVGIYGVAVSGAAPAGLTFNANGTFTYTGAPTTFTYCGNGATSGAACAPVTLGAAPMEAAGGITMNGTTYTANATFLKIAPPGTLSVDSNGGFNASVTTAGTYTFSYTAKNSQGTVSSASATVTLIFPAATGLAVRVLDGTDKTTVIGDYRWVIEEDRTFYVDPKCTTNPPPVGCPGGPGATTGTPGIVPTFGTNFHTSY